MDGGWFFLYTGLLMLLWFVLGILRDGFRIRNGLLRRPPKPLSEAIIKAIIYERIMIHMEENGIKAIEQKDIQLIATKIAGELNFYINGE